MFSSFLVNAERTCIKQKMRHHRLGLPEFCNLKTKMFRSSELGNFVAPIHLNSSVIEFFIKECEESDSVSQDRTDAICRAIEQDIRHRLGMCLAIPSMDLLFCKHYYSHTGADLQRGRATSASDN